MRTAQTLPEEVESLPVDERLLMIDQLLRTLHGVTPELDRKWLAESNRRLREIKSGAVKAIPGTEVLAEARRKLR